MSDDRAPYREGDPSPRYVCIVCFGTVTTAPGACRQCGAPMSSLDDLAAIGAVRDRAQTEQGRLGRKSAIAVVVPALVIAFGSFGILLATGILDLDPHPHVPMGGMGELWFPCLSFILLFFVFSGLYPRVFKQSAERQRFDVANADIPAILDWLGLHVETISGEKS